MSKTIKVEIKDGETITGLTMPLESDVKKDDLIQRIANTIKLANAMAKLRDISNA